MIFINFFISPVVLGFMISFTTKEFFGKNVDVLDIFLINFMNQLGLYIIS
jgi:hypothetical protein